MARVLLLLPTATYRAPDFLAAAGRLGVEVVVGSERRQALAGLMGDRAVVVPLSTPSAGAESIAALHARSPLDAVLAVDDQGLLVAAAAAERLGLPHNPPGAVGATRDKAQLRRQLAQAGIAQPAFRRIDPGGGTPDPVAAVGDAAVELGFPCVLKPTTRSASQGVIRADSRADAEAAAARILAMLGTCPEPLLVERFVPGPEVAVEGLLQAGRLHVLAVFDKPDPLDGPFFEETIYVTPSRHRPEVLGALEEATSAAAGAIGLVEGPVHAEFRVSGDGRPTLLELAARSIGGLCARALRFGAGISLEEVILRHAVGRGVSGVAREPRASGVMMLPITGAGRLLEVKGQERARAVPGVVGLEISIAAGHEVVPLPEGDRYLGFLFARGPGPADVERSLRRAHRQLEVRLG